MISPKDKARLGKALLEDAVVEVLEAEAPYQIKPGRLTRRLGLCSGPSSYWTNRLLVDMADRGLIQTDGFGNYRSNAN